MTDKMTRPHRLRMSSPHGYGGTIECPGDPKRDGCLAYWETDDGCRCISEDLECLECRPGPNGEEPEHWGCGNFTGAALGVPYCHQQERDECGVKGWFGELGLEIVAEADFPTDETGACLLRS